MSPSTSPSECLDEYELLDCNFKCMKCFYGHYSYGQNRICFKCKTEMSSYREIRDSIEITKNLQAWYKEMSETIHTTWTTDEVTDRIEHILRSLSS